MKKAPEKFRFAAMAVDCIVLGIKDGQLHGLVSPVNRPPHYVNTLGFLGGIVESRENAEESCLRILKEKGSLTKVYVDQLAAFSDVDRDKRNRVVSVAYLVLVRPDLVASYQHEEASFVPLKKLTKLAYDHDEMLVVAKKKLKGLLGYTTVVQHLLSKHFTLSEMQEAYELILHKELDKRNFRKKILSLDIVEETGEHQEGVKNRPAALYKFSSNNVLELQLL